MLIRTILASLIMIALTAWQAPAQAAGSMYDLGDIKVVKAVWDITTGNEARFNDRIGLIKQTAEGFRKKGIKPDFVVLIHAGATKFITKTVKGHQIREKADQGYGQDSKRSEIPDRRRYPGPSVRDCHVENQN